MPNAVRVIDHTQDLADWDQASFTNGQLVRWDAVTQKFVGVTLLAVEGSDARYSHHQGVAATVWVINHNLGKYPSVSVVDSSNRLVMAEVEHTSVNQCLVKTSGAFSGYAYCN